MPNACSGDAAEPGLRDSWRVLVRDASRAGAGGGARGRRGGARGRGNARGASAPAGAAASSMITTPDRASAAVWTLSGRYAWSRTTGRPNRASVSAWPAPHARPSRPGAARAVLAGRTRSGWTPPPGGRGRTRGAGRAAAPRTGRTASPPPCASSAIQSSSPNMASPTLGLEARGSPRRAGRMRCRRRSAAAAPGTSTRRPSASSRRAVGASSNRFWNTPPDSTTVDRARPLGRALDRRSPSRPRARCGTARTRTAPARRDPGRARSRGSSGARRGRAASPVSGSGYARRLGRVGRRLQLHGRLALVVHLGSDAAQGGHRVEQAAGARGDAARRRPSRASSATWRHEVSAARARAGRAAARGRSPSAAVSHAHAIRHGCRTAASPPGQPHREQQADALEVLEPADEQLAAPDGAVVAVAAAVEDRAHRRARARRARPGTPRDARGGAAPRSAARPRAPSRASSTGTPGAGRARPPRARPRTGARSGRCPVANEGSVS